MHVTNAVFEQVMMGRNSAIYDIAETQSEMPSGLRRSSSEAQLSQPSTNDPQRSLCGRSAESAGERRGDVWCNDLLGRFIGQLLGGRRADAGRRIDQATVVDDLFDL